MSRTSVYQLLKNKENNVGEKIEVYHSFCPYRVCPLGAHVDHQLGLVTGFAIDQGTALDYVPAVDGSIEIYSENFEGQAVGNIHEKYYERQYSWADFVYGCAFVLRKYYDLEYGIKGIISGSLLGGGLSSSASVILTYLKAFTKVNSIILTNPELINLAIQVERDFIGVNVGKLDQSTEVYSRKNHLFFLDTQSDSQKLYPVQENMPDFEIAIVFSGMERKLAGSKYNMRVDECKASAYALKGYAGIEYGKLSDSYLRDIPFSIWQQYKNKLPKNWLKRSEHFYAENERVKKGIIAWQKGDLVTFGKLVFESGDSSINLYETGSEELKTLHEIMKNCDGIYGGRFSGAGFNGCSMALIDPVKKDFIKKYLTDEYLKVFPDLADQFKIVFCQTQNGIE
ncbi:MAG: GHMP kinase [Treponema sp.]|nr:GHMP kinase [Treponema sp.]